MSTRATNTLAWALLLALPLVASCGYHLAGTVVSLPPDIKTIHVGTIENDSRYFGLEKNLAFALENAILRWGALEVTEDPESGDAVLGGRIRMVSVRPVSFDSSDLALQYEITVVADFYLQRSSDAEVIWEIRGLRQFQEYSAVADVVVTSSAQFQQGTLDANDLPKFTQVQLAESEERMAMKRVLRDMANDAYASMTEGF